MKNIVELQNGENRDGVIAMVAENLPEILPQVQIEQDDGLNLQSILEVLNDPAPQVVATDQINQEPMEIEMPAALPSTSIAQHTGLDEHGENIKTSSFKLNKTNFQRKLLDRFTLFNIFYIIRRLTTTRKFAS